MSAVRGRLSAIIAAILLAAAGATLSHAAEPAKLLFGAWPVPSVGPSTPYGSYARGCLAGAVALSETAAGWQAMRLSRNRNWGHPETLAFIERLSDAARGAGWPRIYIGDISQPRGGPMNGGHTSHQIGLDVDIWLRIPSEEILGRAERETITSTTVVRADRLAVNGEWRPAHHALIRLAAADPSVDRIFVNAAIKKSLCAEEPEGDRAWLGKIRPWWGHDSHFHVRLRCPEGAADCVGQEPPPPGDGCGAELDWWFTDEALNPKPGPEKPELTVDDLPRECRALVAP